MRICTAELVLLSVKASKVDMVSDRSCRVLLHFENRQNLCNLDKDTAVISNAPDLFSVSRNYRKAYEDARELLLSDDFDACTALAKQSLR